MGRGEREGGWSCAVSQDRFVGEPRYRENVCVGGVGAGVGQRWGVTGENPAGLRLLWASVLHSNRQSRKFPSSCLMSVKKYPLAAETSSRAN